MNVQPFPVRQSNPEFVIIEFFGGDNNLSSHIDKDLSEMASGAADKVAVLAIADYLNGPPRVIEVTGKGGETVLELDEIDTGDPAVMAPLLSRALVSYPGVSRIAIGFWDHGSGVFGEDGGAPLLRAFPEAWIPRWQLSHVRPAGTLFVAKAARLRDDSLLGMLNDSQSGGLLTNREAGRMLHDAFAAAGRTEPVDLIFSDTCLNGMVEVVAELQAFAHCLVGSEEMEPADGWDYGQWFSMMAANPPANADAWGAQAVQAMEASYINRPRQFPVTMGAVRTSTAVTDAFGALIAAAKSHPQAGFQYLDWARSQSQMFTRMLDTYDMLDFAGKLVSNPRVPAVATAAAALEGALRATIVDSIALGRDVAHANGLAFWFPRSHESFEKDVRTYAKLKFDQKTGWSKFLGDHYQPASLSQKPDALRSKALR